jgi:hypothetical protein
VGELRRRQWSPWGYGDAARAAKLNAKAEDLQKAASKAN